MIEIDIDAKLRQLLEDENIKKYVRCTGYKLIQQPRHTVADIEKILFRLEQYLKYTPALDSYFTTTSDTEFVCRLILCELLQIVEKRYSQKLYLRGGGIAIDLDDIKNDYLDLFICEHDGSFVGRISTIFDMHHAFIISTAFEHEPVSRLIMELVSVYNARRCKSYGFITNFKYWQLYSFDGKDSTNIVEIYDFIKFENVVDININDLAYLINTILYTLVV